MRVKAIAILIVCAVLLSGCQWISITDLQNCAIVQGVGLDWENGVYEVTMQVFSPDGAGGQTVVDPSQENARIITCRGASVSEAVAASAANQRKEFYLGHNRILILGAGTMERPLEESLGYFANSPDSRMDVTVLATPGEAASILDTGLSQTILPALSIESTVRNAQRNGLSEEVLLIDVAEALMQPHRAAVIPIIELVEKENSEKRDLKAIALTGLGIFSKEGCQGILSGDAARGLLFLQDKLELAQYTLEDEDYRQASVELYSSKTRIIPQVSKEQLHFHVEISAEGMLVEKFLREDKAFTVESLNRLEEELEKQIESDCRAAWEESGVRFSSDVFQLGDLVWNDQPELWLALREKWPDQLDEISFSYDVQVEIDRAGMQDLDIAGEG